MIAPFVRYYNYTLEQVLNETARAFFALTNEMYKMTASDRLSAIEDTAVATNGGEHAERHIDSLKRQTEGVDKLIREAKTLRKARGE